MTAAKFDYARYLSLKKSIDDASLNREVWAQLAAYFSDHQSSEPLRILEIGGGIGTMIQRLLEADLLRNAAYTVIELEPRFENLAAQNLAQWCSDNGRRFSRHPHSWHIDRENGHGVEIRWETGDVSEILPGMPAASFDLVLGHAVLDLLPVPLVLPKLLARLGSTGAFYFSLNYAGETRFEPSYPADDRIVRAYHHDMDWRFRELTWQASRTGLHLGEWLASNGCIVQAQGSSNWSLSPHDGTNPVTQYFMTHILDTIEQALMGLEGLADWLTVRREQLAAGDLGYFAANQDFFGLMGNPYMATRR